MPAPAASGNARAHILMAFVNMDYERMAMQRFPAFIQEYLLFNAPVSFCVSDVEREFKIRMGRAFFGGTSEDAVWRSLLRDLKYGAYHDSVQFYGLDYPRPIKQWTHKLDSRPRRVVR